MKEKLKMEKHNCKQKRKTLNKKAKFSIKK